MMWHFYEIPYIPDLELVKYQSLGEQGIDGILERHNRFLRQWQRNTVLIHTTLHFFLSYTHERPKGSRLQIFLAFSSDQTVNFESIDALMESINDSLRDVENKAYDVSKDANQNLQSLEQIRQNVDDEITDSQKAKKKLDQTKKLLDTLGVGKSLEKGVNKLDDHLQEATGLKGEVISAMQDLEKVYRQLDQI